MRSLPVVPFCILAAAALGVVACRSRGAAPGGSLDAASLEDASSPEADAASSPSPSPSPSRAMLTGASFPEHVVALTWDDGPDVHTLELARFLRAEHVAATFFVVHEWKEGLSEEPGRGGEPFHTGTRHLPIQADLVRLGHRVANHTENHVLLTSAPENELVRQLDVAQARLLPFEPAFHFFRPPGGAWSARASDALARAGVLARLDGPIGWDVDGKDWECSLYCRSSSPELECEPGPIPGERRVRAEVVARRYLERIVSAGHGIVLLHDRVGHVGSRYALDVAERLVPALAAKGFVFAAPVLAFGAFARRADVGGLSPASDLRADGGGASGASPQDVGDTIGRADLNGDGRPDECGLVGANVLCALALQSGFARASRWAVLGGGDGRPSLADVNADGRADLCVRRSDGVFCALSP